MSTVEYHKIVKAIVNRLSPKKRNIYFLSRVMGKSNTEIAKELNITRKTVKNHLWKIMEHIKVHLYPHLD